MCCTFGTKDNSFPLKFSLKWNLFTWMLYTVRFRTYGLRLAIVMVKVYFNFEYSGWVSTVDCKVASHSLKFVALILSKWRSLVEKRQTVADMLFSSLNHLAIFSFSFFHIEYVKCVCKLLLSSSCMVKALCTISPCPLVTASWGGQTCTLPSSLCQSPLWCICVSCDSHW